MSPQASQRPRAATCEDWDDDADAVLPASRKSASIAASRSPTSPASETKSLHDGNSHDGSDSGYSSKAGTNDSVASGRQRSTDLKIDTKMMERERHPYAHVPSSRAAPTRQPSTKTKDAPKEKSSKKEPKFRHREGICVTCDRYGYHFEPKETKEPSRSAVPAPPPSPKTVRLVQPKAKDEDAIRPTARRLSSRQDARPVSMYEAMPPIYYAAAPPTPVEYAPPTPNPAFGWTAPPTPISTTAQYYPHYVPDAAVFVDAPPYAPPEYMHGAPPAVYGQYAEPAHQYPPPHMHPVLERRQSQGSRPRPVTVKSTQAIEDERRAMPPPMLPRSSTKPPSAEHMSSRRQSFRLEDYDHCDLVHLQKMKNPPSAYKPPTDRPRPHKSYSTGSGTIQPSSSTHQISRRVTDPYTQREMEVEAYQARTSKAGSAALTVDALRKIAKQQNHASSDVGSARSHQSSSRGSSGGHGKASTVASNSGRTNITINDGLSLSVPTEMADQPFEIKFGNMTLSVNGGETTEQRRLERAPSDVSASSRRSTSGADAHALTRETTRDSSRAGKAKTSTDSSRRSSRTPSMNRPTSEAVRFRQEAFQYSGQAPEVFYYGA